MKTQEFTFKGFKVSGFLMLTVYLLLFAASIYFFTLGATFWYIAGTVIFILTIIFVSPGFFQIEPNDVRVMMFFGKYKGTMRDNGFFWINPFYKKEKLTERARNMDVEPIKVNDKTGNPVMIGLVLVWKVRDTYKAMFDIDSTSGAAATMASRMSAFESFVSVQSDSALRNIAGGYAYDNNEAEDEITLRSGSAEIADRLEAELNNRLSIAGIEVVEARINYLAYAPEIAAVMLRRQQASAIISAREKIVEGAVSMVQLALNKLDKENVVALDDDKKAAMVSNLMVVLCSDEQTQPIVNTGTLYQ